MIAKCLKCKQDFDQGNSCSRHCGCAKYQKVSSDVKYWHDVKRFIQDPIYQYLRLSHTENLSTEMRYVRPSIMVINKPNKRKR